MNYRWQETLKILIPGFYFILYSSIISIINNIDLIEYHFEEISKLSSMIIVFLIFTSYITGTIIEILSGTFEYCLYIIKIPRPSRIIINECFTRFKIEKNDTLKQKLNIIDKVDNKKAAKALREAKQTINMDICQEFYYQSILARNLFISHLIVSILCCIFLNFSCSLLIINSIVFILFLWQWFKMNLVYVKKIFIEFLKDANN